MAKARLTSYTRVHHGVLALFQLGLLSKREMQLCAVVIRESWGWDGGNNNWTHRRLQNDHFVELSKMAKTHVSQVLQGLVADKVILEKERSQQGAFYSFNEHADQWEGGHKLSEAILQSLTDVARVTKTVTSRVTESVTPGDQNGNPQLPEETPEVTESVTEPAVEKEAKAQQAKKIGASSKAPKDSLKDSLKDTLKAPSKEGAQAPPSTPQKSARQVQNDWITYTQERWQKVFHQEITPSQVQLLVHESKKFHLCGFRSFEALHVWIADQETSKRVFTGSVFLFAKKVCEKWDGVKDYDRRAWKNRDPVRIGEIMERIRIQRKG